MARLNKDHLDKFYDYDIWIEGRTLYIGAVNVHGLGDEYSADEISPFSTERVLKGLAVLETKPEEPIKIILNSPGGDVYQGFAIYDAIKRSPCHITILATGWCMSAASIILQAADHRQVSRHCALMIHDGSSEQSGGVTDNYNWAKFDKQMNQFMYKMYADSSGKPATYWAKKCKRDYMLTSADAVREGLADEII